MYVRRLLTRIPSDFALQMEYQFYTQFGGDNFLKILFSHFCTIEALCIVKLQLIFLYNLDSANLPVSLEKPGILLYNVENEILSS